METRQEFEKRTFHEGYAKAAADILEQVDGLEADRMPAMYHHNYQQRVLNLISGDNNEDDNVEDIFMDCWHEGYTAARNIAANFSRDAKQRR